jgi:death-on-curing protein
MRTDSGLPTPRDIIEIHDEIEREYDLKFTGARVASPKLTLRDILDDIEDYEGMYLRAASLLRDLITAHVFEDGNKRTAWTVTVLYLENHDAEPAVRDESNERVLRRIRRFDTDEIAEWLASGNIDDDRLEP